MGDEFELKYSIKAGLEAGTWTPAGIDNALVTCPNDKTHVATIGDHHIDADGVVTPSLMCFVDGCGFHENVKLFGWNEPL